MLWTVASKVSSNLQNILDRALEVGEISRKEYLQLTSAILADYRMSDEERRQINRIFDYVQTGRLRLTD
jgi:hypothetical protein